MITIAYTPTREIVGGAGTLSIEVEKFDLKGPTWYGSEHKSMDGTNEVSTLDRIESEYDIKTVLIEAADIGKWREFAYSVANGETFTIDAVGVPGIATGAITYRMDKKSYRETRVFGLFSVSFRAKKAILLAV